MAENQIITDGVDVSGCEFYGTTFNCDCIVYCLNCKDKPNCNYKQLARMQNQYNEVIGQNKNLQAELREKTLELNKKREEVSFQARVFNTQRVRMLEDINKLNDKCKIAKANETNAIEFRKALQKIEEYVRATRMNSLSRIVILNIIRTVVIGGDDVE